MATRCMTRVDEPWNFRIPTGILLELFNVEIDSSNNKDTKCHEYDGRVQSSIHKESKWAADRAIYHSGSEGMGGGDQTTCTLFYITCRLIKSNEKCQIVQLSASKCLAPSRNVCVELNPRCFTLKGATTLSRSNHANIMDFELLIRSCSWPRGLLRYSSLQPKSPWRGSPF